MLLAYNNGNGSGDDGELNINSDSRVSFCYNTAHWNAGVAVSMYCNNGVLIISIDASMNFSQNYFNRRTLDLLKLMQL